jgi:hypothetical protein
MTIPSSIQRFAAAVWPVTIMVLAPVLIAEAVNLWRKNRQQEKEVQFSNNKASDAA